MMKQYDSPPNDFRSQYSPTPLQKRVSNFTRSKLFQISPINQPIIEGTLDENTFHKPRSGRPGNNNFSHTVRTVHRSPFFARNHFFINSLRRHTPRRPKETITSHKTSSVGGKIAGPRFACKTSQEHEIYVN